MRGRRRRRRIEEEAERMQMRNRRLLPLPSPRVAVTALIKALTAEWAYTRTRTHVIADEQRWQRAARFGENIGYRMKGGAP